MEAEKLLDWIRRHRAAVYPRLDRTERRTLGRIEMRGFRKADGPVLRRIRSRGLVVGGSPHRIPEFFPSPVDLVDKLLYFGEMPERGTALEPSAGRGDLAERIRERHPSLSLDVIEKDDKLRNVLLQKGFNLIDSDFLGFYDLYNRVIMVPPMAGDIAHCRHAYDCLAEEGILMAVISDKAFSNSELEYSQFRRWLGSVGAEVDYLPKDTFQKTDFPVRYVARIVRIRKDENALN